MRSALDNYLGAFTLANHNKNNDWKTTTCKQAQREFLLLFNILEPLQYRVSQVKNPDGSNGVQQDRPRRSKNLKMNGDMGLFW